MTREFVVGQPYFFLRFAGEGAASVPVIESFIYIGRDLDPGIAEESRWFFQDPDSYFLRGAYEPHPEDRVVAEDDAEFESTGEPTMAVHTFGADVTPTLLTLEQLAEALANRVRTGAAP